MMFQFDCIMVTFHIGQAANFQHFGHIQQRSDLIVGQINFTFVHKLHHRLQFRPFDIAQYDDGMLTWIFEKQRLKVRRTGGQHHFMSFYRFTITGQCYIDERFVVQQLIEHICQI